MYTDLISLQETRNEFALAIDNSSKATTLHNRLEPLNASHGVLYAYKGAVLSLMAKHARNPYTKLQYLDKASKVLNEAVKQEPANIESRYLRLSVELSVPAYLGYNQHVEEDKRVIAESIIAKTYAEIDHKTLKNIASFVVKNAKLDADTIAKIKKATGI